MKRVLILIVFLSGLVGCSSKQAAPQPDASAAQTLPSAAPNASAPVVAPTPAAPAPGASVAPPLVPSNPVAPPIAPSNSKEGGKQAKVEQKPLPPDLWQRMTRPLTLEEINKLPPETRDMILRAQGRLPASPAPKKK